MIAGAVGASKQRTELYLGHDSVRHAGEIWRLRWRLKDDRGHGKGDQVIQITQALNERRCECWRVVVGACFEALAAFQVRGLHVRKVSCVGSGTSDFGLSLSECHLHRRPRQGNFCCRFDYLFFSFFPVFDH
jgi:hypothetical protein